MSNKEDEKKGNIGCFIVLFLFIASGIPPALKHAKEGPIGSFVIIILGIALAWYVAKSLTKNT